MSKPGHPRLPEEAFDRLTAELNGDPDTVPRWIEQMATENPGILRVVMAITGGNASVRSALLVYKLLEAQPDPQPPEDDEFWWDINPSQN